MKKILLFLTGGTICSVVGGDGFNNSDAQNAKTVLVQGYKDGDSKHKDCVIFENMFLTSDGVLSENMTVDKWNLIIKSLRSVDFSQYDGIIMLHGTDTLAYTSALMSVLLAGTKIPVFIVSSNYILTDKRANGNINFKVAADLIARGVRPNVYVPYRNSDGKMYIHLASRIKQCEVYSENFYSAGAETVDDISEPQIIGAVAAGENYINKIEKICPDVLIIFPYVSLDYSKISIDGCRAVLHSTYHSQTVCVERYKRGEKFTDFSVLTLKDKCDKLGIPLFLFGCSEESFSYSSTGDLYLRCGGNDLDKPEPQNAFIGIYGMTLETSYAKLLCGIALTDKREKLVEFVRKNINCEYFA